MTRDVLLIRLAARTNHDSVCAHVHSRTNGRIPKTGNVIFAALTAILGAALFVVCHPVLAGDEAAAMPERIDPAGIKGSLVICGGGALPDSVRDKFIELAGGKKARLVIIPTAGDDPVDEDARAVAE